MVDSDEDILNEFKGFIQALKRVGVDYSIIVDVEGGRIEHFTERTGQFRSITQGPVHPGRTVRELEG